MERFTFYDLEEYLKEKGFDYDFQLDNRILASNKSSYTYERYISYTLQTVTRIIDKYVYWSIDIDNNNETKRYNIELINQITKCLLDSNNIEFKYVAWNSFFSCHHDEQFILYNEMKEATDNYLKYISTYHINHTKDLESQRLLIKPNTEEYGEQLSKYIDVYDKKWGTFGYISRKNDVPYYFTFALFEKSNNELVGNINFTFYANEPTSNVSYYVKKKFRKKGYIKEAFSLILDAIRNDQIVLLGDWNREWVLEEMKPTIKLLRITVGEDNIASFNTAKALGFEYEGKRTEYERDNEYSTNHSFVMKI